MKLYYRQILILLFFLNFGLSSSRAEYLLYDSEASNVIKEISDPIFKAAGLKNPKILFILSDEVNAFTDGGENLYIYSGLITKFRNPDMIRAVIAHEVGHISSNHVSKTYATLDQNKFFYASQLILGGIVSAATKSPELIMPSLIIASHTSSRNMLKNSRENEFLADKAGVNFLLKAGYNPNSMLKVMEFFSNNEVVFHNNSYDRTHPISNDRIRNLENIINAQNKKLFKETSVNLKNKFDRLSAKLLAYEKDNPNFLGFSQDAKLYGLSIIYMKNSDKINALKSIDKLLEKSPNDPYLLQTKGDILLFFGDKSSLDNYLKAKKFLNDSNLDFEYAIAGIKLSNNKDQIKKYLNILERNFVNGNYNLSTLEFLSIAYDKIGQKGESVYFQALIHNDLGDYNKSKKLAKLAKKLMIGKKNTYILRADDIIYQRSKR